MTLALSLYFDAIRSSLKAEVLPHVQHEHARSQLLGALDVLDKLSALADWSPALQAEQNAALSQGLSELGKTPETGDGDPAEALAGNEAAFARVIAAAFASGGDAALPAETEAIIQKSLRAYLAAERSRIAAANYSAMT